MTDREALRQAYDRQAPEYGRQRNPIYDAFRDRMLDRFAQLAAGQEGPANPPGGEVLDLGSGPGHESVLLRERGLRPLAVDFSPVMVEECRRKGIPAVVMDLYDLDLPPHRFAGAWMSFSLLHVPKADVPGILRHVAAALRPGGALMVLLFEGAGEGLRLEDVKRYGVPRYFSYYREDELAGLLGEHVVAVESHRLDISPRPTLVAAGRVPAR